MTRIKTATVILIIILVLCLSSMFIIRNEIHKLQLMADDIILSVECQNKNSALENTDKIIYQWNKSFKILNPLVRGDKLITIQTSVIRIRPLIENDSDEIEAEIQGIKSALMFISENEVPYWYNVI